MLYLLSYMHIHIVQYPYNSNSVLKHVEHPTQSKGMSKNETSH